MTPFDRGRPYASVYGHPFVKYEQDGRYYDQLFRVVDPEDPVLWDAYRAAWEHEKAVRDAAWEIGVLRRAVEHHRRQTIADQKAAEKAAEERHLLELRKLIDRERETRSHLLQRLKPKPKPEPEQDLPPERLRELGDQHRASIAGFPVPMASPDQGGDRVGHLDVDDAELEAAMAAERWETDEHEDMMRGYFPWAFIPQKWEWSWWDRRSRHVGSSAE